MAESKELFPSVTAESLRACRWEKALPQSTCYDLADRFQELANEAASESKSVEADSLRLLASLCGMRLDTDSGRGPFHPAIQFADGRRSPLPEDFGTGESSSLAEFIDTENLPAILRARIADIVWLRLGPKAHKYSRIAIDSYLEVKPSPETWVHGQREEWVRAVNLCRALGRGYVEKLTEIETALSSIILAEPTAPAYFVQSVAELLRTSRMGRPMQAEIANRLEAIADQNQSVFDFSTARDLLIESSKWFARAGDESSSARAMFKAAETAAKEAEFYESRHGAGDLMASAYYEKSIQLFRQVPRKYRGDLKIEERITTLRHGLRESHERSLDMMVPYHGDKIDLTSLVEASRKAVSGKDLAQALHEFLQIVSHPSPDHWREQAGKALREFPLTTLFSSSRLSKDGRLLGRSPGISPGDRGSEDWNRVVDEHAIRNHGTYQSIAVYGAILPALDVMNLEHNLAEADFVALARQSPVVPYGRELTIGRGLSAGYRRDFVVAAHLLTPQIENIVRVHVAGAGGETRKLDADSGVESELGLSALIQVPQVEKTFGSTIAFELRSIFCDVSGPNLRNSLAHGLLDDSEISSTHSIYAWWFSLKFILMPLMPRRGQRLSVRPSDPG